jgi:hypothetical protein
MSIRTAYCHLTSAAPYSQSRAHETPKLDRETSDAHEKRTWREKCHYDAKTLEVFIPAMSFKMALDAAAKMLGEQIPGRGKSTYSKFFKSGVLCLDPVRLGIKRDDVPGEIVHANADGVRGSGKRVWRHFPRIDHWSATVPIVVAANEITQDVFERHLTQAGSFVGIGRFRPENGGYFGRFAVEKVVWGKK